MRIVALLVAFAIQASGRVEGPRLPYEDLGACPFECCIYRDWTAKTKLTAYESHNPRAPKRAPFTIAAGERVTAMTGIVRTLVAGVVLVTEPTRLEVYSERFPNNPPETLTLAKGERVYLLRPRGEGWMTGWYGDKVLESFDANTFRTPEDYARWQGYTGTIERAPEFEWWVRVRNPKGRIGWVLMPRKYAAFTGPDACGGLP